MRAHDLSTHRSPSDSKLIVKRIIALPGDTVRYSAYTLTASSIHRFFLFKVKTLPPYPDAEVRIPDGRLWVEGQCAPVNQSQRWLIKMMTIF